MNQHKLFSTLKIIINASWAANTQIGIISEGSCDTVDWSNADLKKQKNILISYRLQTLERSFIVQITSRAHRLPEIQFTW